jgi:hypothetical protein
MSLDAPKRLRGDGAGKPELSSVFGQCKLNAPTMKPEWPRKRPKSTKRELVIAAKERKERKDGTCECAQMDGKISLDLSAVVRMTTKEMHDMICDRQLNGVRLAKLLQVRGESTEDHRAASR